MARCRLRRGARQLQPWSRLGSKGSDDASGHGAGEERRMERSLECSHGVGVLLIPMVSLHAYASSRGQMRS